MTTKTSRESALAHRRLSLQRPGPAVAAVILAAVALLGLIIAGPLRDGSDFGTGSASAHDTVTAAGPDTVEVQTAAVEVEFQGKVVAMEDGVITVATHAGEITVYINLDTDVDGRIFPGVMVEVIGKKLADGSVAAAEVKATPIMVEFHGKVVSVGDGVFTVATHTGDVTVYVNLHTKVDGKIKTGFIVDVIGKKLGDGSVAALEVRAAAIMVEFEGKVTTVGDGVFTVATHAGEVTVYVNLHTEVDGMIMPGVMVEVLGKKLIDGSIAAIEVAVADVEV